MPFDFDMDSISPIESGGSANIESLSITPTTSAQTITASGGVDGYSPVEVSAVTAAIDANIVAGNIKKDVQILGVTGSYEGSTGGKYQLLQRIKDDNNVEIGTVCGFFTDANNVEYAVVCLDAQYRGGYKAWLSVLGSPTNMPIYDNLYSSNVWEAKETATENTQLILDYCTANNYTSAACTHCRSKSFVINGVTYYGQLPNLIEVLEIAKNYHSIETMDTSASANPNNNFSVARSFSQSNQAGSQTYQYITQGGLVTTYQKNVNGFVCPVLELPNAYGDKNVHKTRNIQR